MGDDKEWKGKLFIVARLFFPPTDIHLDEEGVRKHESRRFS